MFNATAMRQSADPFGTVGVPARTVLSSEKADGFPADIDVPRGSSVSRFAGEPACPCTLLGPGVRPRVDDFHVGDAGH